MKLIYVLDYIFRQTPDGRVWTDTSYDAAFWAPYLEIYSNVTVVSRIEPVDVQQMDWRQVNGGGISVAGLPLYRGALQYWRCAREIRESFAALFAEEAAVILRSPSNLARCAARELRCLGRQYAVDVVGDPEAALAPGIATMPGRAFFRSLFTSAQERICREAIGVNYVAELLRKRYPCSSGGLSLVCSDVQLGREWFANAPRLHHAKRRLHVLTIATLSQTYKGIDELLEAFSRFQSNEYRVTLTIIGSGRHRSRLEDKAHQLGVHKNVTFAGSVPWGPKLREHLRAADLFVLPSRVEVMPRALLEAMACGLPAIATNVGAIAEVLDSRDLVEARDHWQLANAIMICATTPARMNRMSATNLAKAREFSSEKLLPRWFRYHRELRRRFEQCEVPLEVHVREPHVA